MAIQHAPVHAAFDMIEWAKAFGWGFVAFPVVVYVIRTFGKQIWADVKTIWSKMFAKAETQLMSPSTITQVPPNA